MRRTATIETRHQTVEIWKSDRSTEMRVAGATHAFHHRDRFLTGLAWDMITASALLRPAGPPRSVLMLGLAGGTAFRTLRHLLPDVSLTAVDIDGEIIELARDHCALDEIGIETVVGDAYPWLAQNRRRFDIVIDDIYLAGRTDVFRPRSWDPSLLGHLKRAIAPGGLLAVNLVTGAGHRTMQSQTRRVLKEAFPVVRSIVSPDAMNEVLVGGAEVATARALLPYRNQFPNARDRNFWDLLRVHKL